MEVAVILGAITIILVLILMLAAVHRSLKIDREFEEIKRLLRKREE